MSATVISLPNLLGQQVDGLNGLRLAVFARYGTLLEHLRPLEKASQSAYLDDDIRLFHRYHRCYLDRLASCNAWMERACRLLGIKNHEDVIKALRDEIECDRLLQETFKILREASMTKAEREAKAREAEAREAQAKEAYAKKADARTAAAPVVMASAGEAPGATAGVPSKAAAASGRHFSQNEIGATAPPHQAPAGPAGDGPTDAGGTRGLAAGTDGERSASPPSPPGGAARAMSFPQNEIRRPSRLRPTGAGSWTEPLYPRPLIIMGREVFPRELDDENGDKLFE